LKEYRGEKRMTKAISIAAKTKQIVKAHGGDKSAMIAVLQDIQEDCGQSDESSFQPCV
jgi:hypothetical protein